MGTGFHISTGEISMSFKIRLPANIPRVFIASLSG
jgi:hypothetical protein